MSVVILIPARYQSSRFPGKPLAELTLPNGQRKSLLQLTWEAACAVSGSHPIHVLTDDYRIQNAAEGFGASVIMTSATCRNGTERCAEAAAQLNAEIIINLQGDAPLTPPWFIDALIAEMQKAGPEIDMATPVLHCDATTYAHLREDRQQGRVGATTAVFDAQRNALYFSKELLPWFDPDKLSRGDVPVWHHVGIYAYRKSALAAYARVSEGRLETLEGLEQLRFLENGHTIRCVEVEARGRVFWELNNPEDIPRIETALKALS
jgi:3-deoxy-manno-octulosonate cytidylyltransferase (CMP-KDO synthetase)